jgi:hypothetical protein
MKGGSRDGTTRSPAYRHQRLGHNGANLALSKHILIQDMINSKLQDDKALKDDDIHTLPDTNPLRRSTSSNAKIQKTPPLATLSSGRRTRRQKIMLFL